MLDMLNPAVRARSVPSGYGEAHDWAVSNHLPRKQQTTVAPHRAVILLLQDIIRVRRAEGSLRAPVADHMTSPALTVGPTVTVRQAAKIMLQHKIRRLPVVDRNGHALG